MLALTCVNINLNNIIVVTSCMCCVCVYELGRARDQREKRLRTHRRDSPRLSCFSALDVSSSSLEDHFHARSQWYV